MSKKDAEAQTSKVRLWAILGGEDGPDQSLYTILRHVSASGMQRRISVVTPHDGEIIDVTWHVANILGRRITRGKEGVVCNGAGMDMGFELVYSLSAALYGDGYALNQRWL